MRGSWGDNRLTHLKSDAMVSQDRLWKGDLICVKSRKLPVSEQWGRASCYPEGMRLSTPMNQNLLFLDPSSRSNIGRKMLKFFCGLTWCDK